ncbi:Tkl protein kinase, partial [Globisporangium splendens]
MGKWRLVEVLKVAGAAVLVLLFCWNLSMLSAIVQPSGHKVHSLRSPADTDAVNPSALNDAAEVAETKDDDHIVYDEKERPWFLNPEAYERESGCDFSAAVQALRPEQLEINCENIDELKLEEFLGQGFWREVSQPITLSIVSAYYAGREVAVKVVKEKLMNRSDIITRHVEEVAAIFPVRNAPNIVSLVGWCNTTVVVDYVPQKLDELLYESSEVISVRRALELARDAARGLAQLHGAAGGPFAHTDIQTRQFLVDKTGKLLLNDFNRIKYAGPRLVDGVSTDEKCTFETPIAKGKWRSPEEYEHIELDEKLDVYSLSLVLWSLQSREKPFGNLSRDQVYEQVPLGTRPPVKAMSGFPPAMQDLIVRAWDTDPAKRPSAATLAATIEKILEEYEYEA